MRPWLGKVSVASVEGVLGENWSGSQGDLPKESLLEEVAQLLQGNVMRNARCHSSGGAQKIDHNR
jgi:hypothetical protein